MSLFTSLNLILLSSKLLKTYGTNPLNAAKSNNFLESFTGLKLKQPLQQDVCSFSKDASLNPKILDELLKVKGTQIEKVTQIKDSFLRVLGYKHPELVKVVKSQDHNEMSISFINGSLSVKEKPFSPQKLVASVRHEVDHIDKFAKMIKAEGLNVVKNAFKTGVITSGVNPESYIINDWFWLMMSKDANIKGFDAKKYLKAFEDYCYEVNKPASNYYEAYCRWHKYAINEIEKSAYSCEKKVLKYYGEDDFVTTDLVGERFGKIKTLIEKYESENALKNYTGSMAFNELYDCAVAMTDSTGVKVLKYFKDSINGKVPYDKDKLNSISEVIKNLHQKNTQRQQAECLDKVYNWLLDKKFTINDIEIE